MLKNRKVRRALKAIGLGKEDSLDKGSISKQYYQKCAEAGELQYKIGEFQKALAELNGEIRKLNIAFSEMQTEERAVQGAAKAAESEKGKENAETA